MLLGGVTLLCAVCALVSWPPLAVADEPTPGLTVTPSITQPTPPGPTPTPVTEEPSPTSDLPTNEPTHSSVFPTATGRSAPSSLAPSATPTRTPSRSATPTAVTSPIPPSVASTSVPVVDIVTAVVVLALTSLLLWQLTRTRTSSDSRATADADARGTAATETGPGAHSLTAVATEEPRAERLAATDEDDVLAQLVTTGEALIDACFDVNDVQSELHRIAIANGLPDAEIVAMPTVLVVSTRSGSGVRTGAVTAGQQRLMLHQIEALDDIVVQSRSGLDPREAVRRIHALRTAPPPFGPVLQLLGSVLGSIALAVLLDSSWVGLVISGLLGALTGAILLVGQRLPGRYQPIVAIVASSAVSLIVFLLAQAGLNDDVVPTLIAPLIMLLPGALLTTAVIELATGQMLSGAGRAAAGAMQLLLLGIGIVGPALLVGVPALDLTAGSPPLGTVGPWLAVGVFGIGIVMNLCARPRSTGWILIVLYVAYGAQVLGSVLVGPALSGFVGALAMSPVADLVARQRSGPPAIVSFTPAFWILVPGALGLMGVATLLSGDAAGQDTVLTTVVTMVAIAIGILVGRAISTTLGLRSDRAD